MVSSLTEIEKLTFAREGDGHHGRDLLRLGSQHNVADDGPTDIEPLKSLISEFLLDFLIQENDGLFPAQKVRGRPEFIENSTDRVDLKDDRGVDCESTARPEQ
jgi:hypothetical protein